MLIKIFIYLFFISHSLSTWAFYDRNIETINSLLFGKPGSEKSAKGSLGKEQKTMNNENSSEEKSQSTSAEHSDGNRQDTTIAQTLFRDAKYEAFEGQENVIFGDSE